MKSIYSRIYLDYNATTPCAQEVVDVMLPYFNSHFGNASSSHHTFGWLAKDAIEEATDTIAKTLCVSAKELHYTSGATESINAILKGLYAKHKTQRNHIITTQTAHKAELDVCHFLESEGATVTYLKVNSEGLIDIEELNAVISEHTLVVTTPYANNETGVIQPLENISKLCKANGSFLFSDATQALGKIALDNFFKQVDFACFSGHKLYGPKGIGLTYTKEKYTQQITTYIHGGGQQHSLRGGTYNTPSIIGLSKAISLATCTINEETKRLERLRNQLQKGLSLIEEAIVNSAHAHRLPNTLHMSFKYVDGENLLRGLSQFIAVSNGSACNSTSVNPSHVLTAMGISATLSFSSLRFSLGRYTTVEDIEHTISIVTKEITKQRASNILWERRTS